MRPLIMEQGLLTCKCSKSFVILLIGPPQKKVGNGVPSCRTRRLLEFCCSTDGRYTLQSICICFRFDYQRIAIYIENTISKFTILI